MGVNPTSSVRRFFLELKLQTLSLRGIPVRWLKIRKRGVGIGSRDAADAFELLGRFYHLTNDELGKTTSDLSVLQRETTIVATGLWVISNQEQKPEWVDDLDSEGRLKVRGTWGRIRIWIADHLFKGTKFLYRR